MKNGECTEPGIQSSEKRTLVSARAVPIEAAHKTTATTSNTKRPICFTFPSLPFFRPQDGLSP